MPRLIDADEAYNVLTGYYHQRTETQHEALKEALERVPTIDAEPIRYGHWIVKGVIEYTRSFGGILYEPVYKCSCCGNLTESYVRMDKPIFPEDADYPNYCPNCGARMDGDDA